jgi:hypothetical protein
MVVVFLVEEEGGLEWSSSLPSTRNQCQTTPCTYIRPPGCKKRGAKTYHYQKHVAAAGGGEERERLFKARREEREREAKRRSTTRGVKT